MSSPDSEDLRKDLLAARERDLKPLIAESEELLELDDEQAEAMEDFLDQAWFSGIRSGQTRMNARVTQRQSEVRPIAIAQFEADFKDLMEQSAKTLDLSLQGTVCMWELLHQSWMAGNRTCEAELMGLYLELTSDVTEEAQRWLEEEDGSES